MFWRVRIQDNGLCHVYHIQRFGWRKYCYIDGSRPASDTPTPAQPGCRMNEPGHRARGVGCVSPWSMRGGCTHTTPPAVLERANRLLYCSFNGRPRSAPAAHLGTKNLPTPLLAFQPTHPHTPGSSLQTGIPAHFFYHLCYRNYHNDQCSLKLV